MFYVCKKHIYQERHILYTRGALSFCLEALQARGNTQESDS